LSPLNKEQLQQIKEERREEIKLAALKVFAKKGITGTKMSLIAEEAGVSVGLAYRYFKSKEELLQILVEELLDDAGEELDTTQSLPKTPIEQIRSLTQNMLDEESRYAFMLIHQVRKADVVPEKIEQILAKNTPTAFYEKLLPIFEQGQKEGQIREGDTKQVIAWYFLVINSLLAEEEGDEVYGIPSVDFLLQLIQHPYNTKITK
jgi:AcrR family transcriptional regulator